MKKIILTSIIVLVALISFAGEKEYTKAMEKNLQELEKANSAEEYLQLVNAFLRIAEEQEGHWLPYYYAAYSFLNHVFSEDQPESIDETLDKADAYLEKARQISPENSEIEVLQGWIYQGRIQVDPMGRGKKFSQKASASFGKAQNLNPDNPRIYFLNGQNVLFTPEMFGGGKEAACPYFLKAKEKYSTFEPASSISPNWGEEYNNKQASSCKK